MNYLSWEGFCPEEYFGANIYKFFNYFDDLLLIITCISIFLYFLLKKYKDKKLVVRIFNSLLLSIGLYFIVIFFRVILSLVSDSGRDYGSGGMLGYSCISKSAYSLIFFFQYVFFFALTYINTRIWYSFFDKNKKHIKWINIIFIILMIVILIMSFFTSVTLN